MARKKEYNEDEVIEKAMQLFWSNGYETTSVRMLEKTMGINQFSIYSSFGSKKGVFLESIKCYRNHIKNITNKLNASDDAIEGLKQYFYDFLNFSMDKNISRGCLVTNTVNELGDKTDPKIIAELVKFSDELKNLFVNNLKKNPEKDEQTIEKQANYLVTAMMGLSTASKIFNKKKLEDFIETTFEKF